MTSDVCRAQASPLEDYYNQLDERFGASSRRDYAGLVVPNGNAAAPVHRWFHLKEAYSEALLERVLSDQGLLQSGSIAVVDPFVGGGTTGVSLARLCGDGVFKSANFVGLECNPFLQLVASAKIEACQRPTLTFGRLARKIAATAQRGLVSTPPIPNLATFANEKFFDRGALEVLLRLRQAIQLEAASATEQDLRLAYVCLGAAIEPVSSLRRDGRALRFVPQKVRARPIAEFLDRAALVEDDMPAKPCNMSGNVLLGDGRQHASVSRGQADLVVFSPPYPNNIDYTEVYKMENWLLGLIGDQSSFRAQRLKTIHSHPSVRRDPVTGESHGGELVAQTLDLVRPLLLAIPADRYSRARREMVIGYFADMFAILRAAHETLRPEGHLVFVVGNSLHGSAGEEFVIAADALLAACAERVGFHVDRIDVARKLHRRHSTSERVRESVVFARKVSK